MSGRPTLVAGYKTIRYRKEFDSDEWIEYEIKIDTNQSKGDWQSTDFGWSSNLEKEIVK